MGDSIIVFIILMLIAAVITREPFVFVLVYFFSGIYLIGNWWTNRIMKSINLNRQYPHKVFPGERIMVSVDIKNNSLLPAVWLHIQDIFPPEVALGATFHHVTNLAPKSHTFLNYQLFALKRGYYQIGPAQISTSDLLGLSKDIFKECQPEFLTVYPKVIPLSTITLPSRSPLGTLKYHQPIYEDPSRPMGKRDYQRGDSLRRIDWKASASTGRLQVKTLEPSIALDTVIFLDLNHAGYPQKHYIDATELSIIVASSISNWLVTKKQSVGLVTNGNDPLSKDGYIAPIAPRKGRTHLMQILEKLARIKLSKERDLVQLLHEEKKHLGWGTTIVIITGNADQLLFEELIMAKKEGLIPIMVITGENSNLIEIKEKAKISNIAVYSFVNEIDLNVWQR